jgi:hypothetical protein
MAIELHCIPRYVFTRDAHSTLKVKEYRYTFQFIIFLRTTICGAPRMHCDTKYGVHFSGTLHTFKPVTRVFPNIEGLPSEPESKASM